MTARILRVVFGAWFIAFSATSHASAVDRNFTAINVVNTTTETDIYNFSVPAGLLANSRGIRLLMWGTYQNNSLTNKTVRIRCYYGTTLVCDGTSQTIASNAVVGDVLIEFVMFNNFATNAQKGAMRVIIQRLNQTTFYIYDIGTAAIDSTVAQTMRVTVTHSAASGATTLRKVAGHAMLL